MEKWDVSLILKRAHKHSGVVGKFQKLKRSPPVKGERSQKKVNWVLLASITNKCQTARVGVRDKRSSNVGFLGRTARGRIGLGAGHTSQSQ